MMAILVIQLTVTGVVLYLLWRVKREMRLLRVALGSSLTVQEPSLPQPAPGTTFLLDDAEAARREAVLRRASQERVKLMPVRTPEGGFRSG